MYCIEFHELYVQPLSNITSSDVFLLKENSRPVVIDPDLNFILTTLEYIMKVTGCDLNLDLCCEPVSDLMCVA